MIRRLLYLTRCLLLTVCLFITAKLVFIYFNGEGHALSASDIPQVIWHGLSLDFSTAIYFILFPLLVSIVSLWWNHRCLVVILRSYWALVSAAMMLAFVADTSLYPFWGFKLDVSCLQYLEAPAEASASVSGFYLFWRLLVFVVGCYVLCRLYWRIKLWHKSSCHRLVHTLISILLIPLLVIGIRGGLDESTTNIGQVYFSQNQFLNHAAVNPIFSFLSSFEKTASNIVDYDYYDEDELQTLTADLYPTTSVDIDTLLTTTRPNIVIVLMESAGDLFADVMPNLQRLKQEGIDFTNCYGNTWRTDRGTICTYSGYPSFPTSSVMKMPHKTRQLPSIASSLQKEGYHTSYLYGGDINFTNMRSYLVSTGWETLIWKADYDSEEQQTAKWGVRDDITFNTLYKQITAISDTTSHYLFGYSTLSSHEPWDVPMKQVDDEIGNAFYYLDHCIGDFITRLKQTPQWKNLLIIFLPDHSVDYKHFTESVQARNKIPMVWVGGAVKQARQIPIYCNQTDLAATLLAQLRLPHDAFRWSRDVLSQSYQYPFAVHNYNNGFSIADSTGFMVYDLESQRCITDESRDAQRLERLGKAILQTTTADLKALGTNQ